MNRSGVLPGYGDADVIAEASKYGAQYAILGKDLRDAIRTAAQAKGYKNHTSFSVTIPPSEKGKLGTDLRALILSLL